MIEVLAPGTFTTLQDLGRSGHAQLGVPGAGAADALNLCIANRIVGNPDSAAALEMTAAGARLRFTHATRVALAGGTLEAQLDGQPVPLYQTLSVKAGAELICGRITRGWRCYLAVSGGIDATPVLGSRSTDTLAGLGPVPIAVGMTLPLGASAPTKEGLYLRAPPRYLQAPALRILPGPHQDWFAPGALRALRESAFEVTAQSDRTGVRLKGPDLPRLRKGELPSMGMVNGALQVPGSGQAIALLANHGATGGYPVIANVISADLHFLAQLAPGAEVRFTEVSRTQAIAALKQQEQGLHQDLIAADAGLLAARGLMMLAGDHSSLQQAAVNDGHRRIRIRK